MTRFDRPRRLVLTFTVLALLASGRAPALAQIQCYPDSMMTFPRIALCAFPGHFQDYSQVEPYSDPEKYPACVGVSLGPLPDSIRRDARTVSLRFKRDRRAEARRDFGGYRIYRVTNRPDTARMELIRRFSRQPGDERTWKFSTVDADPASPTYLQFMCQSEVVNDSVATFVDPDESGSYQKRCRTDSLGRCIPGDSLMVLVVPAGPHDGFRIWYAVTYEAFNSVEKNYADLFVPDTLTAPGLTQRERYARCDSTRIGDPRGCPNLNSKSANIIEVAVEPTGGPAANLERVGVVPNPYRAHAPWDLTGGNEVHFVNLPQRATVKIFTLAGDLVTTLQHNDPVRDFERWNLKNESGRLVASGIYMYLVESGTYSFRDRFIVIR